MTKKINSILKDVLEKVSPPKEDLEIIENSLEGFFGEINKKIKSLKINAEVFVGGSLAKNTIIKKGIYDVDIFVRFNEKYDEKSKHNKHHYRVQDLNVLLDFIYGGTPKLTKLDNQ